MCANAKFTWSSFLLWLSFIGVCFLISDFSTHLGQAWNEVNETIASLAATRDACMKYPNSILYREACKGYKKWAHMHWAFNIPAVVWEAAKHTSNHVSMPDGTNIVLWIVRNAWAIGVLAAIVFIVSAAMSFVQTMRAVRVLADNFKEQAKSPDVECGATKSKSV